jgi:CHASE3 domain sensor protein
MDAFQGYYKDGTDGSYDYRSASCIGFLLRFIVCVLLSSHSRKPDCNNRFVMGANLTLIAVSLFYAHVRPCKKQYMNVVESILYILAAVVVNTSMCKTRGPSIFDHLLLLILMPSVLFVGAIVWKLIGVLGILHQIKKVIVKMRPFSKNDDEVKPHKLTHPTQYTPLLH